MPAGCGNLDLISIRIPKWMLDAIDELVAQGIYPNRTEFIREAVRSHLREVLKTVKMEKKYLVHREEGE